MNKILEKINDTVFYRYYHINATPFEVSIDNINKYGKGIYFLDNPYFYQDKFKDGMLIKIKPNLKNPKFYIEGSDITPNADYSAEIIDSLKNNIKNRNEFSDKLIKEGYDSIVAIEPRGIYLVMLYNDPDNYEIISDKKNIMAIGGEIKPLDFVYESITNSIEELITKGNYLDLTLVEALFFYKAFNNMPYGKGKFLSKDGLKGAVVKKLINTNYIDESWLVYYGESDDFEVSDDNYSPTEKGLDFLNSIKNRHQTRIGLKEGIDLFPENANIKEYDERISKNKEKLDKLISTISSDKFRTYDNGGQILLAPNGKPSNLSIEQYKLVRTPDFKEWFGDWENDSKNASKVVDENGEPLVVYHGTVENFNVFDRDKLGSFTYKNTTIPLTGGFFFSDDYNNALSYVKRGGQSIKQKIKRLISGHVKECFLNIRDMYKVNGSNKWDCLYRFKETQECFSTDDVSRSVYTLGDYDGILFKNVIDTGNKKISENESNLYLVFFSNQIKLADGTNKKFDNNNEDIRYYNGGELKKNSKLLSKEFWYDRVHFLKDFNFFTDMPRFEKIFFQNNGSELSKISIIKDDIIKIKLKSFFEFIVYKHNIDDRDFWYFIVKPTFFLKEVNGEDNGLMFTVYLYVIKQLSESNTLRKEIMVSKDTVLTDEQINSVVNDVNQMFFKIENFINDFDGKLTF